MDRPTTARQPKASLTMRAIAPACSLLLALIFSAPIFAADTPDPSTVTIAGSLQQLLGCPGNWQPDCSNTQLSLDTNANVWKGTFNMPVGDYEYKAAFVIPPFITAVLSRRVKLHSVSLWV